MLLLLLFRQHLSLPYTNRKSVFFFIRICFNRGSVLSPLSFVIDNLQYWNHVVGRFTGNFRSDFLVVEKKKGLLKLNNTSWKYLEIEWYKNTFPQNCHNLANLSKRSQQAQHQPSKTCFLAAGVTTWLRQKKRLNSGRLVTSKRKPAARGGGPRANTPIVGYPRKILHESILLHHPIVIFIYNFYISICKIIREHSWRPTLGKWKTVLQWYI